MAPAGGFPPFAPWLNTGGLTYSDGQMDPVVAKCPKPMIRYELNISKNWEGLIMARYLH